MRHIQSWEVCCLVCENISAKRHEKSTVRNHDPPFATTALRLTLPRAVARPYHSLHPLTLDSVILSPSMHATQRTNTSNRHTFPALTEPG